MSVESRKEKERAIRQNDILDAAESLFEVSDIFNVTIQEIADKAEYTKKTIYSYFISKYDLYLAVIMRAIRENAESYSSVLNSAGKGDDKLRAHALQYFKCNFAKPQYFKLLQQWYLLDRNWDKIKPEMVKELSESMNNTFYRLKKVFDEGIEDGSFRSDIDSDEAVNYYLNSLRTIFGSVLRKKHDHETLFKIQLEFLLHSFLY